MANDTETGRKMASIGGVSGMKCFYRRFAMLAVALALGVLLSIFIPLKLMVILAVLIVLVLGAILLNC